MDAPGEDPIGDSVLTVSPVEPCGGLKPFTQVCKEATGLAYDVAGRLCGLP
jgi:hypothetical protein